MAAPPWTSLRELEQISLKLEEEDVEDNPAYLQWLNMLIAPGSSLGGARPKASVQDTHKQLWIAKFPSVNDDSDVGAWEMLTHQLARQAGVHMADAQIARYTNRHHTFITRRFDRASQGKRLHFASAMTMLGYVDGDDYTKGLSYLELASFIIQHGAQVNTDLEQLWQRIVFSICVSNVDDHLRNHGFILTESGWILSPAYDINPVETGRGLKLNISENDNSLDLRLALDVAPYFRLDKKKAEAIIEHTRKVVRGWADLANELGINKQEQRLKAAAFDQAL